MVDSVLRDPSRLRDLTDGVSLTMATSPDGEKPLDAFRLLDGGSKFFYRGFRCAKVFLIRSTPVDAKSLVEVG